MNIWEYIDLDLDLVSQIINKNDGLHIPYVHTKFYIDRSTKPMGIPY